MPRSVAAERPVITAAFGRTSAMPSQHTDVSPASPPAGRRRDTGDENWAPQLVRGQHAGRNGLGSAEDAADVCGPDIPAHDAKSVRPRRPCPTTDSQTPDLST